MLTFAFACTSAHFASSASTTAKWPYREAVWSGVPLSCGAGEHRDQRLPSHQKHTLDFTHECMLSLMPTPRTYARVHIYTRTDMPTHEKTHMHTHAHARTHIHRYTNLCLHRHTHPTPLTAPELSQTTRRTLAPRAQCCSLREYQNIMARHSPAYSLTLAAYPGPPGP
jgi:hypothetical protein